MEKQVVLELQHVDIVRSKDLVVEDATFSIEQGDYVGVVGPNGGGKTTLLLAMLGFLPIKNGSIRVFSEPIQSFTAWERIAYVPQGAIQVDDHFPLTVRELVALGRIQRKNIGRPLKKSDWEAVDDALHLMDIEDLAVKRLGTLSGGQKQRAFIAKALVRNPEILILDEPIAGIDATSLENFYKQLSDLNRKKTLTIVIVSHDLSTVFCRMTKLLCVNKKVYLSDITKESDPNIILKKVYGDHFHFVFHKHECTGDFHHD
ncbi:MAG: metal ABC transporter ATP-binding protein [Candidatus Thermoplasmatota archaeon]|nr:metal ABC transporter ATP-binding protein [Candidatus Thermoplasmatota archaeon]